MNPQEWDVFFMVGRHMTALILSQYVNMEKLRWFCESALWADWLCFEVCDGANTLSFSLVEKQQFQM